ncbi:ABC transporter substrate-binding protein [Blautia producta]|uniref:ABC transporter substrate-binding protein YesO n=1 Tax=Blautia producta TaxID=33035 RepID=A0A4P6LRP4_9FIRM|nr:extracellular solute-binding protein [Blautia producta]QBE94576.1 Putative ABC transporter substrate-binding protein YesO [Blautia producta]
MKMKSISLVMAGILAASALAGCGNQSQASEGKGSETAETKKLVVWGGVPGEDGPDKIVEDWNKQHPEVQAEYVRFVNDDTGNTKLDTALQSGEQIDIFFTYSPDLMVKRASSGMLEDLENLGAKEFVDENILGGEESFLRVNNKIYGIPTVTEPTGIMINKDMLDAKGITIPENWTISDYEEVARQLTGEVDGKKVYGCNVYWGGGPLSIAKSILGGDEFYKSDTETNFDAKEYQINTKFKAMMDEGIAMPYEEIFSRKLDVYSHPAFLSGEIAMMPFSAWMLRYVNDKENFPHDFVTTFAPFPSTDDGTPNPYQSENNNTICMNSQSKNKEEAWEFIKFWITEGSRDIAKMPAWSGAAEDEIVAKILGDDPEERFDVEAYKKVMLRDDFKYIVPTKTTALSEITQIYKEESQNYFLGVTSEEDYYKNLKERADKALQSAQ